METGLVVEPRGNARVGVGSTGQARALRLGVQALSDDELVTLLAGASVPGLTAQGLRALAMAPAETLLEHQGVSARGAARLLAAFELGRRAVASLDERPRLMTPDGLHRYLRPHLGELPREEVHVLCLGARNVLLRHARAAHGTIDACPVDPRDVFGPAVAARASAVIVAHNHPSGDAEPSPHDVRLTRVLKEAGGALHVRLLDHLIIGRHGYVSLLERGLL